MPLWVSVRVTKPLTEGDTRLWSEILRHNLTRFKMTHFNRFSRNYSSPTILKTICKILVVIVALTSSGFAANCSVVSIPQHRPINIDNSPSYHSASLPVKIIGSNSFITGITFRGFDLKKIYPYFSVDIANAHNPSFHPLENHHLYSGIMLLTLGKITHKHFLTTMGTVLIVDDLIEHSFNVVSALHYTANHVDGPLYAKLTQDGDALFGRGKR